MSGVAILSELQRRGVSVTADGDALILKPRRALDSDLLARVREHKPEIIRALSAHSGTCAASCYEIEPGRWIHRSWNDCRTPMTLQSERRKCRGRVLALQRREGLRLLRMLGERTGRMRGLSWKWEDSRLAPVKPGLFSATPAAHHGAKKGHSQDLTQRRRSAAWKIVNAFAHSSAHRLEIDKRSDSGIRIGNHTSRDCCKHGAKSPRFVSVPAHDLAREVAPKFLHRST